MSRNERWNSISHLVGAALALPGLAILVASAAGKGDGLRVFSLGFYGLTLVTLYSVSALYHGFHGKKKLLFQKLDHVSIYLLIAGTYTPFMLVSLRGAPGWTMFGLIWALAILGSAQDLLLKKRNEVLSVSLYVLMGWLALAVFRPLERVLPAACLIWLIAGGVFYSAGVVFYALGGKLRFGHPVFHLFVLAGSILHYIAITYYVA